MKTLSTTLGVARSNVIERRDGNRSRRGPQERPGNVELAGAIRTLVDMRPSYGYRRIAALSKRERQPADTTFIGIEGLCRRQRWRGCRHLRHGCRRPVRVPRRLHSVSKQHHDHFQDQLVGHQNHRLDSADRGKPKCDIEVQLQAVSPAAADGSRFRQELLGRPSCTICCRTRQDKAAPCRPPISIRIQARGRSSASSTTGTPRSKPPKPAHNRHVVAV